MEPSVRFFVVFPKCGVGIPCDSLAHANERVAALRANGIRVFVQVRA